MSNEEAKKNEPFFHLSQNFSSAYFGKIPNEMDGVKNPAADAKLISNFIDLLTNPDKRDLRQDALDVIRKSNAQQFLIDLIQMPDQKKHQQALVMACWETGLDFSSYLIFFSDLVINCEYPVALEAITVIDEMRVLTDALSIEKAIQMLNSDTLTPEKQQLISATIERLSSISI